MCGNKAIPTFILCTLVSLGTTASEIYEEDGSRAVLVLKQSVQDAGPVGIASEMQKRLEGQSQAIPVDQLVDRLSGTGRATEDLERLRGIYQQAYLQSYSFKYDLAILKLREVLRGLEKVPDSPARWDLWVQANIYLGKSFLEKGKVKDARHSFLTALRVRQKMVLSRREHSPKTIQTWEEARTAISDQPTGRIEIESDPKGAEIYLDGVRVGETPLTAYFHHGKYHLKVHHPGAGTAYRWVKIGKEDIKIAMKLEFEGVIELNQVHPAIRIPESKANIPKHWWSWLGARLEVNRIIAVRKTAAEGRARYVASLVDAQSGRVLREGWLEPSGPEKEHMAVDAIDLANFMVTGVAGERVIMTVPSKDRIAGKSEGGKIAEKPLPVTTKKVISVGTDPRPWYRNIWYYVLGGAVLAGGGTACLLVSNDLSDNAGGLKSKEEAADTWKSIAIGGYVATGALVVIGIIVSATYNSAKEDKGISLAPAAGPCGVGIQLVGRF